MSSVRVAEVEAVLSARDNMKAALENNLKAAGSLEAGLKGIARPQMDTGPLNTAGSAMRTTAGFSKELNSTVVEGTGAAKTHASAMGGAGAAAEAAGTKFGGLKGMLSGAGSMMLGMFGAQAGMMGVQSLIGMGAGALKMGGDFQQSTTMLVTGAGMSETALAGVRTSLISMSQEVGTSAIELSKGMYMIESAGFNAADGLKVLKAAAEGAKVGGTDMTVMADALTTSLNAYHFGGDKAVGTTNQMIAAVAAGKMHMSDFAGSLSAVLPMAAAVGLSFAQVTGAEATMTAQGTSAQQASQNLANTISNLTNPSIVAQKALATVGLSSIDLTQNLGKRGLTGTLGMISEAIIAHMGPSGLVLQNAFNQSKTAGADANKMLSLLPASVQGFGKALLDNSITQAEWKKDLKSLPIETRAQAAEFGKTAIASHAFNDSLKGGGQDAKSYNAVLAETLGGTTGLDTALQLTGVHTDAFNKNVKSVEDAATNTKGAVTGWAQVQGDFNTKMDRAKAAAGALAITASTALLPMLGKVADFVSTNLLPTIDKMGKWFGEHQEVIKAFGAVLGVGLVAALWLVAGAAWGAAAGLLAALWPVMLVVAAVALLALGLQWAYKHFEPVRAAAALLVGIFHAVLNVIGFLAPVLKVLGMILGGVVLVALGLIAVAVLSVIWPFLAVIAAVMAVIFVFTHLSQIGGMVGAMVNAVMGFLAPIGGFIGGVFNDILGIISGVVRAIGGVLSAIWNPLRVVLGVLVIIFVLVASLWADFIGLIVKLVTGFVGMVVGFFIHLGAAIIGAVVKFMAPIVAFFALGVTNLISWVVFLVETVVGFFAGLVARVVAVVAPFVERIVGFYVNLYQRVVGWIATLVNNVVGFFAPLVGRVLGAISGLAGGLWNAAVGAFNAFLNGAAAVGGSILNWVAGLAGQIGRVIGGIASQAVSWGSNIINGIINGLAGAAGRLGSAIHDYVINKIPGPIKAALGISSPSTVMAEIGKNVMLGLTGAVVDKTATVAAAMQDVAAVVARPLQAPVVTSASAGGAGLALSLAGTSGASEGHVAGSSAAGALDPRLALALLKQCADNLVVISGALAGQQGLTSGMAHGRLG